MVVRGSGCFRCGRHAGACRRDDNELVQAIGMVNHDLPQERNTDVERHVTEPEQDHARVGQPVAEDEVAEVLVIGQHDALFAVSDQQDLVVR